MYNFRVFAWAAVIAVVAVFSYQNRADVELKFLFWSIPLVPIPLLLIAAFLLGIFFGLFISFLNTRRKSKKKPTVN